MKNGISIYLFISLLFLSSCFSIKPIEYKGIENLNVNKNLQQPQLTVDIKLYNPNNWGLKIKKASFNISGDEVSMCSIGMEENLKVKRKSEFIVRLSGNASLPDLMKIGMSGLLGGKNSLSYKGDVEIKKGLIRKRFHFDDTINLDKDFLKKFH